MDKTALKREKEKRIVKFMIELYCLKKHKCKNGICDECEQLLQYADVRTEKCPFMENKTFCSNCKVHCYSKDMREKIKAVMKFSGPRMILYHPVLAVKHIVETIKERKSLK